LSNQGGVGGEDSDDDDEPPPLDEIDDSESEEEIEKPLKGKSKEKETPVTVPKVKFSNKVTELPECYVLIPPLPDTSVSKTKPGITVSSPKTPAKVAEKKNVEKALLSVTEIDEMLLTADEYGLTATITGQLPAEIEKFRQAMIDEVQALTDLQVYEETDVEPGTYVISVKWVLKEKKATSLSPAKLKARLVARGFTQRYGINYEETHAPVARTASIRAVFAVCAAKGWKVWQIDVNNAYLNGEMDMDGVYVRQPPYFVNPKHPNRVWLLKKGLYGTKQGGKIWYKTFTGYLVQEVGLIAQSADPCLFVSVGKDEEINSISSIYVDDAIMGGPEVVVMRIKDKIKERFPIKDLGIAKHVIGIQVEQGPEGTLLSQAAYIDEILQLTGQEDCNPLKVPMSEDDPSFTILKEVNVDKHPGCVTLSPPEHHMYREYIGKLMYLMVCTRPDIAFAVNFLARACAAPEKRHMQSVIKLVRYLKGTRSRGLFYPAKQANELPKFELVGYVDAAFADCLVTRKSTSGYLFCINGSPVTWKSGIQSVVTGSSTEAEYVAAYDGAKEAVWLRRLFENMGCMPNGPTVLFEDNNSCISQTENPLHHKRTKHIDVAYHFTRQMVEEEVVLLMKISTTDQVADMLTKPLGRTLFSKHFDALKMRCTEVQTSTGLICVESRVPQRNGVTSH